MDSLKIAKADIVGWSDGGILGIDLAIRHKDRTGRVFAFAANTVTSGQGRRRAQSDLRRLYRALRP
jgi:pimeloyl-ACP methyl ester carboxylesterase